MTDGPEIDGTPLKGRSILVVGIYYAPDTTGIAPYTEHLCEALAGAGATIDAVIGVPHYPEWRVNRNYRWSLMTRETRNGVRLHRVRHYVPRRQNLIGRAAYEASFFLASRLASRCLAADAVIAITPNLGALPTAVAVARRLRVPLGVVVQDLVGLAAAQAGVGGAHGLSSALANLEGRWLSRADSVGVIDESFRAPLIRFGVPNSAIVHLPNFTHIEAASTNQSEARAILGWPQERRLVVHTGNMGYKQDLENVIQAARLAVTEHPLLEFVLVGDGSMGQQLRDSGAGLPNVRFVPPLSGEQYPLALAAADCLLVNERATVRNMSLPSKLTSYFCAGRPVLAAVTKDGSTAAELRRSGAGLQVDPGAPAALLEAAARLLADTSQIATLSRAGQDYAMTSLSREAASTRVFGFASGLLPRYQEVTR